MVLEYTDYLYNSEYSSSWGAVLSSGMMSKFKADGGSNDYITDHTDTLAGITFMIIKFSKDSNNRVRGSRYYYYRDNWGLICGRGRMANNVAVLNETRSGIGFVMTTAISTTNIGFGSR